MFSFALKKFGLGCQADVAMCVWKIDGIKNGNSLPSTEDSEKSGQRIKKKKKIH